MVVLQKFLCENSFEVENLNISFSLVGKPNFGLTLKESDNFKKISKGDMVFKNIY